MKTSLLRLLGVALLTLQTWQLSADIYFNPVGPIDGPAAAVSGQFLGARFMISSSTMLSSVGGEFQNMTGSFFVALVPLASMTSLPAGNPAMGVPFNSGEVLAHQIFEADVGSTPQIITTPFSISLTPGVYGVVFGSGLYGASGYPGSNGGMPERATVPGSSSFFWSSDPWRWQNSSLIPNEEFNVMITTVPEPAGAVLLIVGLPGIMMLRHLGALKSRDGRDDGEVGTSRRWIRGRPREAFPPIHLFLC